MNLALNDDQQNNGNNEDHGLLGIAGYGHRRSELLTLRKNMGYVNIGTYGSVKTVRATTKGMCPACGIRERAISKTGVTKSKCTPCAKEYFRDRNKSRSGRRWTSKL